MVYRLRLRGVRFRRSLNVLLLDNLTRRSNDHIRGTFMAQAIATILISVAPNLVSLAMTRPFDNSFGLWRFPEEWNEVDHVHFPLDKFLRRTNADPEGKSYLQNLRDVYIINEFPCHANVHDNYYRSDFMGCLPLFDRLPAVESVGIDLLDVDDDGRQDIEHRTSNISRIRLNHSSLHPVYLARLIYSCKVIREFQYTIGGRAMGGHGNPFFTPIPVFKVLCEHKHTLETLDLDVESHLPMLRDWDENKVQEHFAEKNPAWHADEEEEALEFQFLTSIWKLEGSLKDFTALKSLTIGIGLLLYFAKGVFLNPDTRQRPIMLLDCLPDNLESLCIRGYQRGLNDHWDAQVDALLAHYKSGKSSLKSLTGIEELIPNAVDLEEPIRPRNLRWTLEKIGYEPDEGW